MEGHTLYDYWYVLYRKRLMIFLIVLFSVLFSLVLSWLLLPVYQPRAIFFVPSKPDSMTFYSANGATQMARVALVPEARGEQQKVYLGMLASVTLQQKVHELFPQKSLRAIKKDVDFESGDDFLVQVHVRDRDPKVAADMANAYVRLFDETLSGYSLQATERKRVEMEKQLVDTRTKLSTARGELANFQKGNKLANVDEKSDSLSKYKAELEQEIEDFRVKVKQADKKIDSIRKEFAKESIVFGESSVTLSSNAIVENLQKQISDIESQIARARSLYTESHPEVVSLRAQYGLKRRDLEEEIKKVVASGSKSPNTFIETLRQDLVRSYVEKETLQARINGLGQALENVDRQVASFPFMQATYQELNRRVEQYQKLFENLETSVEEVAAQTTHDLKSVVVVDSATPPQNPIFPDPILNALVAVGLGLVGGMFYAFLMDYSEHVSLAVEEDLEDLKDLELELTTLRRRDRVGGESGQKVGGESGQKRELV